MNKKEQTMKMFEIGIDLDLNDEQAFQFALFMTDNFAHELECPTSYTKTIAERFLNGSIIAYSDEDCRRSLVRIYNTVIKHGGLFMNWFRNQED